MSTKENPTAPMNRRELMRRTGALTVGAAGAGVGADQAGIDIVEEAAALWALAPAAAAAVVLYEASDDLLSSGYSEEAVDEITSTNLHWGIFQSFGQMMSQREGFVTESENWVQPSDPESGALAEMAWSEARSSAFKGISDENDRSTVRSNAVQSSVEYLTVRQQNYIRQANENIFDILRHIANFVDLESLPDGWSDVHPENDPEVDHAEGFVASENELDMSIQSSPDGLDMSSVFRMNMGQDGQDDELKSFDSVTVSTEDYELFDGSTQQIYVIDLTLTKSDNYASDQTATVTIRPVGNSVTTISYDFIRNDSGDSDTVSFDSMYVESPQGGQQSIWSWQDHAHAPLHSALDQVYTTIQSDMRSYIGTVYDEVSSGDLDETEILSPTDYITQFGDSDAVTRLHAELVGLGLSPPSDTGSTVKLAQSSAGLEESRSGMLYLDWSWSALEPWEFDYSPDAGELFVDADSWMPESVYEPTFDNDSIAIPADDFEETSSGYVYSFSEGDLDGVGALQEVATDPAGELNSFIPTGTEVDGPAGHAVLIATDKDEVERISFGESDVFTVSSVTNGDDESLDRYTITGYNQTVRDPARALDQALWYSEQRQTTEDIEKQNSSLFGGVGDWFSNGLLGGVTGLALGGGLVSLGIAAGAGYLISRD